MNKVENNVRLAIAVKSAAPLFKPNSFLKKTNNTHYAELGLSDLGGKSLAFLNLENHAISD